MTEKLMPKCVACDDKPSAENDPCCVCGASRQPTPAISEDDAQASLARQLADIEPNEYLKAAIRKTQQRIENAFEGATKVKASLTTPAADEVEDVDAWEIVRQIASMEGRTDAQTYWFGKARDLMKRKHAAIAAMQAKSAEPAREEVSGEEATYRPVDVKLEWQAFVTWWKGMHPKADVPEVTSYYFDAWMAGARSIASAAMNPKPAEAEGDFETCPACSGQFDGATFRESNACPECETPFATPATEKAVETDTVAFVQEWMMSGDHEADQWHRDFAAAIDARTAPPAADVAAMREACAKVAEAAVTLEKPYAEMIVAARIASAIRALPEEPSA